MVRKTLKKPEILRGKKVIADLFEQGRSFQLYPFKVVNRKVEMGTLPPHRILVSVPKRHFKRAVDRNKLKRRIREAYRHNKQYLDPEKPLIFAYIYLSKEILPYHQIEGKLKEGLLRLNKS